MKVSFALALIVSLSAIPAFATDAPLLPGGQPGTTTANEQTAGIKAAAPVPERKRHPGEIDVLRNTHMSAPAVVGDVTPADPRTGVPQPPRTER